MQTAILTGAAIDARRNFDRDFLKRANAAQRKDCEREMSTAIPAQTGIEESMFDDAPAAIDAVGQAGLF